MRIEVAGSTHVGMKRSHNEDNYLVLPEERLFCVADGMGGHSSGEIASKIAVDEMADFFKLTSGDQDVTWPFKMDKSRNYDENRLATGIKLANARIFERSNAEPRYKGMGTTLVSAHFTPSAVYVGHVGDSRVYLFRAGQLKQLTEDHSLLNDYLKAKKLTPEEIENFPHKNVIVRALGMKETVQVDVRAEQPKPGDIFLLCSDGLSGMIEDADMLRIVVENGDNLEAACEKMIALANKNGGTDNITAVCCKVTGV
jgi:PPM family protein phosphatase